MPYLISCRLVLTAACALRSFCLSTRSVALRATFGCSIGHRMADVSEAEVQAEAQLTSRYWMFLAGLSRAVSHVVAAKLQAAALAVRTFAITGYFP